MYIIFSGAFKLASMRRQVCTFQQTNTFTAVNHLQMILASRSSNARECELWLNVIFSLDVSKYFNGIHLVLTRLPVGIIQLNFSWYKTSPSSVIQHNILPRWLNLFYYELIFQIKSKANIFTKFQLDNQRLYIIIMMLWIGIFKNTDYSRLTGRQIV